MRDWLNTIDAVRGIDPVPASEDASFRRYFRLQSGAQSFIVMDAPPEQEDCKPFLRVAGHLESMQVNAPRVIAANIEQGFLLLSDLGSRLYLESLTDRPERAEDLYRDAMRALLRIQKYGVTHQASLPPYDDALLRFELSLFHDWLCETHLAMDFSAEEEAQWQALCDLLVANALEQQRVYVHRDFHSRNLMHTEANNPGVLDFQDAVEGPLTYDLASLLKDCYVQWPAQQALDRASWFHAELDPAVRDATDLDTFLRQFELMGVQRHLKAAGIFSRLKHRDGKSGYMADIPRTLGYIVELGPRYTELQFVVQLIRERILPSAGFSA